VTIIVVSFLLLLLIMGLTFAFYGLREAAETQIYLNSQNGGQTGVPYSVRSSSGIDQPPEPDVLFNVALGNLLYGAPDDIRGAFNSLRNQEMARTIYGWNPVDPYKPAPTIFGLDPANPGGATQAFNGVGRVGPDVMYDKQAGGNPGTYPMIQPQWVPADRINWSWMPQDAAYQALMGPYFQPVMFDSDNNYFRDPRTNLPPLVPANYRYYARNANFTYPGRNNLFLAALDPTTGKVMVPSFHRGWLQDQTIPGAMTVDAGFLANDAFLKNLMAQGTIQPNGPVPVPNTFNVADPNPWTNGVGRMLMLRPRPVDHQWPPGSGQSDFRYPTMNQDGTYGDVEILPGKTIGRQLDAMWMDLDLPVGYWRGKAYKPLVAFLVVDLDSRININVAGNFYPLPDSQQPAPAPGVSPQYSGWSNMGLGPYEVNPARVIGSNNEAAQLSMPPIRFRTATDAPPYPGPPVWTFVSPNVQNRFGANAAPDRKFRVYPNENIFVNQPSPGTGAPYYAQVDFMPQSPYNKAGLPKFSDMSNGGHNTNIVFGPPYVNANMGVPPYPDPNSRYGNGLYIPGVYDERTNHPMMYNPYLQRPRSLSNLTLNADRRYGVEELRILNEKFNYGDYSTSDIVKAASQPGGTSRIGYAGTIPGNPVNPRFAITPTSNDLNMPGASPWLPANAGANYTLTGAYPSGQVQTFTPSATFTPIGGEDFDTSSPGYSYRAKLAVLGPVDLNRKLTDYRTVTNMPLGPDNVGNFKRATQDRQDLARDIYNRLRAVTTGVFPSPPNPPIALPQPPYEVPAPVTAAVGSPEYNALRWLAQLSVNIVDAIDNDEISTPFNWNPAQSASVKNGWVYGVERPRLELNELYTRIENTAGDQGQPVAGSNNKTATNNQYTMRCWLELHNPLTPGSAGEQNADPMGDDGTHGGYRALLAEQVRQNPNNPMPTIPQTAYRVLIYKVPIGGAPGQGKWRQINTMGMNSPDNVLGVPNPALTPGSGFLKVVDFSDAAKVKSAPNGKTVQPNIAAQLQGKSFFVLGPSDDAPQGSNDAVLPDGSGFKADLTHTELNLPLTDPNDVTIDPNDGSVKPVWAPMFVLQRLANPFIQYAGQANVNAPDQPNLPDSAYVTIDYLTPDLTGVSVYDHAEFTNGKRGPDGPGMRPDLNTTYSWGRRQPYDSLIDFQDQNHYRQGAGGAAQGKIGGQTFGKHNAKNGNWPAAAAPGQGNPPGTPFESPGSQTNDTLQVPFLPLNHPDRILVSPVELMQIAATKPQELTHSFYLVSDPANPGFRRTAFTANWFDAPDSGLPAGSNKSTFLFRAFDYLRAGWFIEGIPTGGRAPGKVNLNTIFNNLASPGQTAGQFNAVADPSDANRFTQPAVDAAWSTFVGSAGITGIHQTPGMFSKQDRPLSGTAIGISKIGLPAGQNSQDQTFTRMGALWQRQQNDEDFRDGNAGSMQKYELMSKTFNQFTTRSNTFAVYMMVGYFEVRNPGPWTETNRPVLGKELGTDDGTVVRNKYFAVVDRTNLTIEPQSAGQSPKQGQPPVYFTYEPFVQLPDATNGFAVMPDPDLVPVGQPAMTQVAVRIPAESQDFGPQPPYPPNKTVKLWGYYDGTLWTMVDDPARTPNIVSYAMLDIGPKAELVRIALPQNSLETVTGTGNIILQAWDGTNNVAKPFSFRHSRGCALRLINPDPTQPIATPGNPGPQPGFNYKSQRYAGVVRYVEQLK
jgi:hypothetical protein